MTVQEAIERAEAILPGVPAPEGEEDPRWQAIILVEEFIESNPEEIWTFTSKWGQHEDEDLRMAIATCLLEHLLEHHFAQIFPKVESLAHRSARFAKTFSYCAKFGQSEENVNSLRFDRLQRYCMRTRGDE
jgi:hypothetical protein